MNITDNRRPGLSASLRPNWLISNPEGYARWFESRMGFGKNLILESIKQQLKCG